MFVNFLQRVGIVWQRIVFFQQGFVGFRGCNGFDCFGWLGRLQQAGEIGGALFADFNGVVSG